MNLLDTSNFRDWRRTITFMIILHKLDLNDELHFITHVAADSGSKQ